LNVIVIDHKHC